MPGSRMITAVIISFLTFLPSVLWGMGARPDASPGDDPAMKPGSPVHVIISAADAKEPMPGDIVEFIVTVRSSVASDSLTVMLMLSGGAELLGGQPSWDALIEKGEEISRLITVRFPEHPGGRVSVRASLKERGAGGGRYSGHASVSAPARPPKEAGDSPEGRTDKDGNGRPIIEYKGQ